MQTSTSMRHERHVFATKRAVTVPAAEDREELRNCSEQQQEASGTPPQGAMLVAAARQAGMHAARLKGRNAGSTATGSFHTAAESWQPPHCDSPLIVARC